MSASNGPPEAPVGAQDAGRRLWQAITAEFDLEEHELALLVEAVRTVDLLDSLAAIVANDGPMMGDRIHPAVVEARQLKIALARLVAALRLPAGEEDGRPQRRVGARGVYGFGVA